MQSKGCGDRPPAAITAMMRRSYSGTRSGRLECDAPEHAAIGVRGMPDGPRNALCERMFVADKT